MTDRPHLETAGTLREHPLAEIVVEVCQAGLSGSLRVKNAERKAVIYFRDGKLVYAASNEKRHRLIHLIIEQKLVSPASLAHCPKGANDVELAGWLKSEKLLSAKELWGLTLAQVEAIVIETLSWTEGEWLFSPLARIRSEMECPVNLNELMVNYARCIPLRAASERFRSVNESFVRSARKLDEITLMEHEAFLLTLFDRDPITIEIARAASAVPEEGMLQGLYVLWLGGFLERRDWNAAFNKAKISEIKRAKLAVAKPARDMATEPEPVTPPPDKPQAAPIPELNISLDDYLARVEGAITHYEVLGVEQTAEPAEIKNAYFGAAKMFHPDRFHREDAALLARVQATFTSLAHAYETLKSPELRQSYNRKMASESEKITRRKAAGDDKASVIRDESAKESYEEGLKALENGDPKSAATHFARAVHYEPDTALYHAYYGKALSFAEKLRHQAEAELQKAAQLAPKDIKVRLMLVDLYEEMNMMRRAEGELRRILETLPSNREVRDRLTRMGISV